MFEKLLNQIKAADTITIFGHKNPDGDCYGSEIAIKESILTAFPNKKVFALGSGLPKFFDLIGKMDIVSDDDIRNSLAILLDANDFSRSEDSRIVLAKSHIKIDHHVENFLFTQGDFVVDNNSDSTCSLVLSFLLESGLPITTKVANALFLGILTDTGRFRFSNNFQITLNNASFLCNKGADPRSIFKVLEVQSENDFKIKSYFYGNYHTTPTGTLWVKFSKEQIRDFDTSVNSVSNLVNLLSNVKGHPVWCCFAELESGLGRVEIRSDNIDVQKVATLFGGGGHEYASGATLTDFTDETIQEVLDACDDAIRKEK